MTYSKRVPEQAALAYQIAASKDWDGVLETREGLALPGPHGGLPAGTRGLTRLGRVDAVTDEAKNWTLAEMRDAANHALIDTSPHDRDDAPVRFLAEALLEVLPVVEAACVAAGPDGNPETWRALGDAVDTLRGKGQP